MARSHAMTPKRRAALRKAQAASARKRHGKGKGKLAAANRRNSRYKKIARGIGTTLVAGAAVGSVAYGAYRGRHKITHTRNSARARAIKKVKNNRKARTVAIGELRKEVARRRKAKAG